LYAHLSRIRRQLRRFAAAAGAEVRLDRDVSGYLLTCPPDLIDLHRFRGLVRDSRQTGLPDQDRLRLLRETVGLWRGEPLTGLPGDWVSRLRDRCQREYEDAMVMWARAELTAGDPGTVIGPVSDLVRDAPLGESLTATLMMALYAVGRPVEALDRYTDIRNRLAEELGVDPGPELQAAQRAVLRRQPHPSATDQQPVKHPPPALPLDADADGITEELDLDLGAVPHDPHVRVVRAGAGLDASPRPDPTVPAPASVAGAAGVPNYLPRAISDFTGRAAAVEQLLALASGDAVDVVLIDGMAGAGKTTLAVRVGHLLADRYSDGRLYIDLHGHSEREPVEPSVALDSLLRQLGVPAERIPDSLDDRSAMWRAELSGRRALVVLDNAADSAQVLPLLSGGRPSLTLVTSRQRLSGVDGAASLRLDVLSELEAVALLSRVVGARIDSDPGSASEVARLCGYLPLALRLAAARLANRPQWSVADLAVRLREAGVPLAELAVPGRTVVAAFTLSYRQLDERARSVFRRLGLHPAGDFGEHVAAALADLPLAETRSTLEDLVDAHLLETRTPGRYRLHDLLRDYAASLTDADPEGERDTALRRMTEVYLYATASASRLLERYEHCMELALEPTSLVIPAITDLDEARSWLAAERRNVLAVSRLADDRGWRREVCQLARVIWVHLHTESYVTDQVAVQERALAAASELGEAALLASAHNYLASGYWRQGRCADAAEHLEQAIMLRRRSGDRLGEVRSLANLAGVVAHLGRYTEALRYFEATLVLWQELGTGEGLVDGYAGLGNVLMQLGRYDESLAYLRQSLWLARRGGRPRELGIPLGELGRLRVLRGDLRLAMLLLRRALATKRSLNNRYGGAEVLSDLGLVHRGLRRYDEAVRHQREALAIMVDGGMLGGECLVLNRLGNTLFEARQLEEAHDLHRRVLHLAERINYRIEEARAHDGLATTSAAADPALAREHWRTALRLFEEMGVPERHAVARKLAALDHGPLTHSSVPLAKT
jgi:tetratricopeptide (TPR) repeat protein/DNA-binding SARP family transcriptional activator